MGTINSKQTLQQCSPEEIARHIGDIGEKYIVYAERIRNSGIDGAFLATLTGHTLHETLDCLEITERLHRRKLERVLDRILSAPSNYDSAGFTDDSTYSSNSAVCLEFEPTTIASTPACTKRNRRSHRKTPSDVPIEMVMECALAANSIDTMTPDVAGRHLPAVFDAVIAAQDVEKENLQRDLLALETTRKLESPPEDGPVAIVLTDVENSTNLWEANPEAMREALALHDSIVRQLREENHGYEIDTEGE